MAPMRACASGSFSAMPMSKAIRRVRVVCCACAEKGDAAQPIRTMNSRRLTSTSRESGPALEVIRARPRARRYVWARGC